MPCLFFSSGEQTGMLMEAYKGVMGLVDEPQEVIVVVEDHEDSLLLLSFILNDLCNGRVVGFREGQALLDQAASLQPALILMDIVLPDIGGVEVMQRLRENLSMDKVPIVAVTALAKAEDRDRLLREGFDDYISKPYLLDDIALVLGRYITLKATDGQ
jgi:two-component system, cell cycle response regulator DivK